MPVIARQLGSLISEALQSRISTASTAVFGAPTSVAPATTSVPVVPTTSALPLTSIIVSQTQPAVTSTSVLPTTTIPATTIITTSAPLTTSTPVAIPTTQPATSAVPTTVPALTLTTPSVSSVSTVPTTTRTSASSSASATGVAANAGSSQESNMSGGIIALIVVGSLLAVLLAGAFAFRRIQVHRRAKRRENNYGAGAIPDGPFPFTNVSESDLKGAQPVRDFRQPSLTSQHTEKPLPSVVPDLYPVDLGTTAYGQPAYNDGMSGPYTPMGAAAYGYGQNRTASPAPSQPQRMMSPAPPAAAYMRAPSPVNPYPAHPQALTPAAPPPPAATLMVPGASLSVPQVSGRKRVIQTFQPSLPDELDIRDGDWVTVVHAYDDGWGLCECNGRRGVVPLECLDLGKPDFRASRRLSSLSAIRQ